MKRPHLGVILRYFIFLILFFTRIACADTVGTFQLKIKKNAENIILEIYNLDGNACQLELDSINITKSKHNQKGIIALIYSRDVLKNCVLPQETKLIPVIIPRDSQLPGIGPKKGSYDFYINGEYYDSLKFYNLTGFETNNG